MTKKVMWTTTEVETYLKNLKDGEKLKLPQNAYCTENFTWNEVLETHKKNISMPPSCRSGCA